MAMGRRESQQESMWVAAQALPRSPGHVFYEKLNGVLEAGGFDRFVEELCAAHYAEDLGRPSIPSGRVLPDAVRRVLRRPRFATSDCVALRRQPIAAQLPAGRSEQRHPGSFEYDQHAQALAGRVFWQVFAFVLKVAVEHKLLKGKTIAVDSTTLEANAAMKSLVRRATNEDWKTYVKRLMKAEGIDDPSDEEVRRFDRKRKKKTSNKEWKSSTDPDSRVTKMKDGRTHLAYKAEHAVELGSGLIVAPVVYRGDDADAETLAVTVEVAREQLQEAGSPHQVDEVVGRQRLPQGGNDPDA